MLERGLLAALPSLQNQEHAGPGLESCRYLSLFWWWRGWCHGGEFGSLRLRLPWPPLAPVAGWSCCPAQEEQHEVLQRWRWWGRAGWGTWGPALASTAPQPAGAPACPPHLCSGALAAHGASCGTPRGMLGTAGDRAASSTCPTQTWSSSLCSRTMESSLWPAFHRATSSDSAFQGCEGRAFIYSLGQVKLEGSTFRDLTHAGHTGQQNAVLPFPLSAAPPAPLPVVDKP